MDRNIKIAKELVRLAKELIPVEKNAKWNWRHPFSITERSQQENDVKDNFNKRNGILFSCTKKKSLPSGYRFEGVFFISGQLLDEGGSDMVRKILNEIRREYKGSEFVFASKYGGASWRYRAFSSNEWIAVGSEGKPGFPKSITVDGKEITVIYEPNTLTVERDISELFPDFNFHYL